MNYQLTLTKEERKAFDWVGHRYAAGDIADLLCKCLDPNDAWDDDKDITFQIPEHIAWQMIDLAQEENFTWPCFAPFLVTKLDAFMEGIV